MTFSTRFITLFSSSVLFGAIFFVLSFFFPLFSPAVAEAQLSPSERAKLESDLSSLEADIAAQRKILTDRQKQSVSLERDVAILNAKIKEAQLSIKARNLQIEKLSGEIYQREKTIGSLDQKLDREQESLAELLRQTSRIDSTNLAEVMLGNQRFSEFFSDLDSFDSIKASLQESFIEIQSTRTLTTKQKEDLEGKRTEQVDLRKIQELQAQRIQTQQKEKQTILTNSRGLEKEYQRIIQGKEASAAQIRSALFELQGTTAISFERALQLATVAGKATGVRPAFILGIIAEETNLGENIGKGTYTVDMHPTRDVPVFLAITQALGLDPNKVPVSKKAWYGYGGAMGPAQFIPSTWVCYGGFINTTTGSCTRNPDKTWVGPWQYDPDSDRIRKLTGKNSASSPWDPLDAFTASALLSKENGAAKQTRAAERLAALRYLAGWVNAEKPAYAFYGDDVMELADKYQRQIDILNGQ